MLLGAFRPPKPASQELGIHGRAARGDSGESWFRVCGQKPQAVSVMQASPRSFDSAQKLCGTRKVCEALRSATVWKVKPGGAQFGRGKDVDRVHLENALERSHCGRTVQGVSHFPPTLRRLLFQEIRRKPAFACAIRALPGPLR